MQRTLIAALLAAALSPSLALAQSEGAVTYQFDGSFDDATFSLENAIIGRGLLIDYISHTGEMLARTGQDVGSDVVIFDNADVFLFCSAVLSRQVMEINPLNIAHCPYGIFVIDQDGAVSIGYQTMPEGEMKLVESLLDDIATEAAGG